MVLTNFSLAAILVLVIGAITFDLARVFQIYVRYRGQRVVTCTEMHQPAAVHVDALKAARVSMAGKQWIRLDQCSRWPEKWNCGQECLGQIQADPENCLVRNMVAAWYRRKSCAYCQKPCLKFFKRICLFAGTAILPRPSDIRMQTAYWTETGSVAQVVNTFPTSRRESLGNQ